MKTTWNLGLLADDHSDLKTEKSFKAFARQASSFRKKYFSFDYQNITNDQLLALLKDWEALYEKQLRFDESIRYFYLLLQVDSDNQEARSRLSKLESDFFSVYNQVLFFDTKLGELSKQRQKEVLNNALFSGYRYLLERVFITSKYNLKDEMEQFSNLVSKSAFSMWIDYQEKVFNQKVVSWKSQRLPISQASQLIPTLPPKERQKLYSLVLEAKKENGDLAATELSAIINYKVTQNKFRGYKKPYESRVLSAQNTLKEVEDMVSLVKENYSLSHRFYKLLKDYLGVNNLLYSDRAVNPFKYSGSFSFADSLLLIKQVFGSFSPEIVSMVENMFANGQVDVYPKVGKSGGAFCQSSEVGPTFILLNHTNDFNSLLTMAHEFGHALHAEYAKKQPVFYRSHSLATAEVASTFFENLTRQYLISQASEKNKVFILFKKCLDFVSTVFRQIALFNFEIDLYRETEKHGFLSESQLSSMLANHLRSYLGKAVNVKDEDGYQFVDWSHIRSSFYVYTYAYGEMVSRALFFDYENTKSTEPVLKFLSAGESMSPKEIFQVSGITINKKFFAKALQSFESDLEDLESLMKKLK